MGFVDWQSTSIIIKEYCNVEIKISIGQMERSLLDYWLDLSHQLRNIVLFLSKNEYLMNYEKNR